MIKQTVKAVIYKICFTLQRDSEWFTVFNVIIMGWLHDG